MEKYMKKNLLPLSESFTLHAAALLNKVHLQPKPKPVRRSRLLDSARHQRFIFGTLDFNILHHFTKQLPPV
jgi:hypothetical protein